MRDYTKIEAWKLADDLTVLIYQITRAFPKEELYGVTSQLRRAAWENDRHAELESLFRRTFACLIGLISAVEKETGILGKTIAAIASAIVLGLAGILRP